MHSRAGAEGAGAKQGALAPAHHDEVPALTLSSATAVTPMSAATGSCTVRLQKTRCRYEHMLRVSSALQGCGPWQG